MLWIDRLRRRWRYLDLSFSVQGGVKVRVIERPGLWMDEAELDALRDDMRDLVARSIGDGLDYGFLNGDKVRADAAVVTVLHDARSGALIAFNALSFMVIELQGRPAEALHLGLVVVDPERRTRGLSWVLYGLTCIVIFFKRGMRPLWISNVTQVPAIIGKVAEVFVTAFPNPFHASRRSFGHLTVAREIMRRHRHVFGVGDDAGFDEQRFVITDAYTGGSDNLKKTQEQAPKHRDARANALCDRELDYARGDDFLQLAVFDLKAAQRYLMREVPRHSLPAVVYSLLFAAMAWMALPLIHWLSPGSAMGTLRARRQP